MTVTAAPASQWTCYSPAHPGAFPVPVPALQPGGCLCRLFRGVAIRRTVPVGRVQLYWPNASETIVTPLNLAVSSHAL